MNDTLTYIADEALDATGSDAWASRRELLGAPEIAPAVEAPVTDAPPPSERTDEDRFNTAVGLVQRFVQGDPDAYPEGFDPDHRTNGNLVPPASDAPALDFEPLTAPQFEALVRRLMLLRAERDAIAANSEAMCADLDRQIASILEENEAPLRHFIDGGYGAKSRRCPWGLCGVRKSGGRVHIVDLERALKSVREMAPSALRETVDLAKLPPHFTAPGFDVTPETSKLYVQGLPKSRKAAPEGDSDDE